MSLLRLHRLSVIWKNWMFNQDADVSDSGSLQVENASESDDAALQGHSRRCVHKVNAGGERQLIVDATVRHHRLWLQSDTGLISSVRIVQQPLAQEIL